MEFHSIPYSFWKRALGCNIEVETIHKTTFSGRLYVMDPQSKSIVLLQDDQKTVIIPGHAVSRVNTDAVSFGEHDLSDFLLHPLRRDSISYNPEQLNQRKDKLKNWLTQNGLDIEDNDGTLKCQDHVFIEAPYKEENCLCTNVILLERIRNVLAKLPAD